MKVMVVFVLEQNQLTLKSFLSIQWNMPIPGGLGNGVSEEEDDSEENEENPKLTWKVAENNSMLKKSR